MLVQASSHVNKFVFNIRSLLFIFSLRNLYSLLVVEGGVRSGNLWVNSGDLLWGGEIVTLNGRVVWHSVVISGPSSWGGVGDVTGGLVWSSGLWVGVVVWDIGWLLSGAWGTGWAILWSVSSSADFSGAVDTIGTVVTVASWEWSGGLNLDWGPSLLDVVEFITLHGDIFSEVLITVHSGGEELNIGWSAGDTSSTGGGAGGDLDESSGGWGGFSVWWLSEEGGSILELDGGGGTDEKGNNSFHSLLLF
jgi:hypothetical protein